MSGKLRFNQLQNSAINYDERGGCCCRPGARLLPSGLRSTRTAENHALPGTLPVWVGGIVGPVARSKGQSELSSAEFRLRMVARRALLLTARYRESRGRRIVR